MARAAYWDARLPVERRVEDLLSRMTIEEKVAQLGSVGAGNLLTRGRFSPPKARKRLRKGITKIGAEIE